MNCISCQTSMRQRDHEGVAIDECPYGHGIWLDRGELRLIAERVLADRPPHEEQAELSRAGNSMTAMHEAMAEQAQACPMCSRRMEKLSYDTYSAVIIDSCPEHGVWLDAGELERVEAYAEGARARDFEQDAAARDSFPLPPLGDGFLSGIALWEQMQRR